MCLPCPLLPLPSPSLWVMPMLLSGWSWKQPIVWLFAAELWGDVRQFHAHTMSFAKCRSCSPPLYTHTHTLSIYLSFSLSVSHTRMGVIIFRPQTQRCAHLHQRMSHLSTCTHTVSHTGWGGAPCRGNTFSCLATTGAAVPHRTCCLCHARFFHCTHHLTFYVWIKSNSGKKDCIPWTLVELILFLPLEATRVQRQHCYMCQCCQLWILPHNMNKCVAMCFTEPLVVFCCLRCLH